MYYEKSEGYFPPKLLNLAKMKSNKILSDSL